MKEARQFVTTASFHDEEAVIVAMFGRGLALLPPFFLLHLVEFRRLECLKPAGHGNCFGCQAWKMDPKLRILIVYCHTQSRFLAVDLEYSRMILLQCCHKRDLRLVAIFMYFFCWLLASTPKRTRRHGTYDIGSIVQKRR
eukprot:2130737-Amphidinium_carterae.1